MKTTDEKTDCFVICRLSRVRIMDFRPCFKTCRYGWSVYLKNAQRFASEAEAQASNFQRDQVITWQQAENLTR
jgi:hypothetical protein